MRPWFEPILEPASGEVESLLVALQAAIGAGMVGFVLGRITKKPEKRDQG
jgi:ABC-type cobalt transport system, periplasmic component